MTRRTDTRRGVAAIEFSMLIALVMVPLMAGVWDISKFIDIDHVLTRAAREAVVLASRGQDPTETVKAYVASAGLHDEDLVITVTEAPMGESMGTEVRVDLAYDFSGYTIFPWEDFMPGGMMVDATAKKE